MQQPGNHRQTLGVWKVSVPVASLDIIVWMQVHKLLGIDEQQRAGLLLRLSGEPGALDQKLP
jgi:hypothetical protein